LWLRLRGIGTGATAVCAIAVLAIAIAAVRGLIPLATAEPTVTLRTIGTIALRSPVVAIAIVAGSVAIVPVAAEILTIATVAIETLSTVPVRAIVVALAVMPRLTIVVAILIIAVLIVEIARLLLRERLLRAFALRLLPLDAELVTVLIAELVAVVSIGAGKSVSARRTVVAERIDAALLRHLLAVAEDDAIVVLCVLKIVFRQDRIARRQRITRQRNILLRNVRGRATDLYVRSRALEATHQGIL
jgi:hypothetical protein